MISISQLEIDYSAPAAQPVGEAAAVATAAEVEKLVQTLRENGKMTAAQICLKWGWPATDNNKRKVRAIASAARPGIVSFPASGGYKLAQDCTLAEIDGAIRSWDAQIREATVNKKLYLDLKHSMGGGAL